MRTYVLAALPVLVLLAVVFEWVLQDARKHEHRGRPVTMSIGPWIIDQPEVWATLCLFAFVFFVPAYLVARQHSSR